MSGRDGSLVNVSVVLLPAAAHSQIVTPEILGNLRILDAENGGSSLEVVYASDLARVVLSVGTAFNAIDDSGGRTKASTLAKWSRKRLVARHFKSISPHDVPKIKRGAEADNPVIRDKVRILQ